MSPAVNRKFIEEIAERASKRTLYNPMFVTQLLLFLVCVGLAFLLIGDRAEGRRAAEQAEQTRMIAEQVRGIAERNAADVHEHRLFNSRDHRCIIDLARAATDPTRDRSKPLPDPCPPEVGTGPLPEK